MQLSWVKGFYKSEDDALFEAIKKFEEKTGVKVELSQYPVQDMIPKTVAALDAGTPPDVAYADVYDFQVTGKWAFDGKLEDITDIITPIKDKFLQNTVETTYLYNDKTKKRAYYASRSSSRRCTSSTGRTCWTRRASRNPTSRRTGRNTGPSGATRCSPRIARDRQARLSASASRWASIRSDSFYSFLTFMDAYNVKLVDDNGKLLVDDPKVRRAGRRARDYTTPYTKGCTPPSSTSWKDPDNNVAFHNKTIIMTHNATISIAAKWLDDTNNATLTAEQRAQAKKNYDELIRTAGFPNKPDGIEDGLSRGGQDRRHLRGRQEQGKRAKEFVAFLLQDENLSPTSRARSGAGSR